jgi:thioredoxin-like negative regulator of GroEL
MNEGERASSDPGPMDGASGRRRLVGVLIVVVLLLALVVAKLATNGVGPAPSSETGASVTITSAHNDAVGDFEAARASGKPVYVLFHSLTCDPCIEISNVADRVMPEYSDEVFFVNAITDDPSGQELAAGFSFRYVPMSFFLTADGAVQDQFTGAMSEAEMRRYLDALVSAE